MVEPFKVDATSAVGGGSGDGAGTQCTDHSRDYDYFVVMQRGQAPALANAVTADIYRQLQATGARIIRQSGDADGGYVFSYLTSTYAADAAAGPPTAAQSIGLITVREENPHVQRGVPLPRDREDEALKVSVYETWFAKGDHSSATAKPGLCR